MLSHEETGSGPPLVLLHFLGADRHVWGPLLPHLEPHRRLIMLDLPGFGESPPLPGTPTLVRLADAVEATLQELDVDRPAVAGLSLGGGIAVVLALRDAVRSAVAVSPVGFATRPEAAFAKATLRATHAACRAMAGQADLISSPAPLRTALGAQMFARPWLVPAPALAALVRGVGRSPGFLPVMRTTMGQALPGGATTTPLTVAWGQRDALLLPRQGRRTIERLPFARLVPLAGCGHVPLWDDPEAVAAVMLTGAGGP